MSWPWESKLPISILPKLVFPIISDTRFWLNPIVSEIFPDQTPDKAPRKIRPAFFIRIHLHLDIVPENHLFSRELMDTLFLYNL